MKTTLLNGRLLLGIAALLLLGACSSPESQRGLNNPGLSGVAIAQNTCSMCHGPTGESVSPEFPKLAGQQRAYLVAQLTDFKGHLRRDDKGTAYMWGFTHLTPVQIQELADYFSSQVPMHAPPGKPVFSARGEQIFKVGLPQSGVVQCSACHGAQAQGNAQFPRLAGQHANYIEAQIKVFQLTDKRPRGAMMKTVVHALSDADARAVAQYLESLGAAPQAAR